MEAAKRKGARSRAELSPEVLRELNLGILETATLSEGLAMDFLILMRSAFPEINPNYLAALEKPDGITTRMQTAGQILLQQLGMSQYERITQHTSDTVRGWAAYMLAATSMPIANRLQHILPIADDTHFGVREWAWLALRPHVADNIQESLALLAPWCHHESANIRRFATEITRPRGVWCKHIALLRQQPELGLPLLEQVKADPSRYVQDSVSNWLNDAAKSNPTWVQSLCARWLEESPTVETKRICVRAVRSIDGKKE